jgi:hypothetical protein
VPVKLIVKVGVAPVQTDWACSDDGLNHDKTEIKKTPVKDGINLNENADEINETRG